MRELLESLLETQGEFNKLEWIKRHPDIIVHNPLFYRGAWYYELGTGGFRYTSEKEGHSDIFVKEFDKKNWVRGRVCDYEGLIICVVYLDPLRSPLARLSESTLHDIKYQCERESKLRIDYVLSDSGETLLERCLLEENKLVFMKEITREFVKRHPGTIFLFGDNLEGVGYGGQAKEMRGEPNAIGVPTKKKPTMEEDAFFTDTEFEENKKHINAAVSRIPIGSTVVVSEAGLGTGLAELPKRAPKTFEYLNRKIGI